MILQVNPPIHVDTPLGKGQALFIIDNGLHQNTCWVVAINKNGTIKNFDCTDVVLCSKYTHSTNLFRNKDPHANGVSIKNGVSNKNSDASYLNGTLSK